MLDGSKADTINSYTFEVPKLDETVYQLLSWFTEYSHPDFQDACNEITSLSHCLVMDN